MSHIRLPQAVIAATIGCCRHVLFWLVVGSALSLLVPALGSFLGAMIGDGHVTGRGDPGDQLAVWTVRIAAIGHLSFVAAGWFSSRLVENSSMAWGILAWFTAGALLPLVQPVLPLRYWGPALHLGHAMTAVSLIVALSLVRRHLGPALAVRAAQEL